MYSRDIEAVPEGDVLSSFLSDSKALQAAIDKDM